MSVSAGADERIYIFCKIFCGLRENKRTEKETKDNAGNQFFHRFRQEICHEIHENKKQNQLGKTISPASLFRFFRVFHGQNVFKANPENLVILVVFLRENSFFHLFRDA